MEREKIKVYMVGIGGSSMSGLCEILLEKDMEVCGSDLNGAPHLESLGVKVFKTHSEKNISQSTQILIYSSAISKDNAEVEFARKNHICMFSRGELLGLISRGFERVVGVSGSHGKTTTTAMIGEIFAYAGLSARIHLGGECNRKKCGDGGEIFLCEACEYRDNFLNLAPTLGVITNLEYDHPDYFKSKSQLENSFEKFAKNCKIILANRRVIKKLKIKNAISCEVENFDNKSTKENEQYNNPQYNNPQTPQTSLQYNNHQTPQTSTPQSSPNPTQPVNFSARNLKQEGGYFTFDFYKKDSYICEIPLRVQGKYNVENALFACAVGYLFGGTPFELQKGISGFFGVKGRLEKMGEAFGVEIFCDYAHHPTQIACTSEIFQGETLVIFQPHTYSRTRALKGDFITALEKFENLAITKTYSAREDYDYFGSGEELATWVKNAIFIDWQELEAFATEKIKSGKYKKLLLLGAGDITNLGEILISKSKNNKQNP